MPFGDPEKSVYFRNKEGKIVHRAGCRTLRGALGQQWDYAAQRLGNDHRKVLAVIEEFPWLQACKICMTDSSEG